MKNSITVTHVNMKLDSRNHVKMKAICSVVINGMISLNEIRVIEDVNPVRTIIAMPSKRMPDGSFRDMCNPINAAARKVIEEAVLKEYRKLASEKQDLICI